MTNDTPLVTILSPCYNVERYLPQCIDSIVGQTYANLQIVMIDDGSTDGTWNVLQQYAARDSRIEVYHQDNQGVATTRNNLLDKASGQYTLFVDSDDWIEPTMVQFLVDKAQATNADIVICAMVKNDTPCSPQYTEETMGQASTVKKFLFHKELSGSLWNKLVKTSLLHGVRFDPRISYGEDALFCWNILQRAHTIIQTSKQLYHYRMNSASISHQTWTPQKKGSGHWAWEKIVEDTSKQWPQFLSIAKARFAMEDFWAIYFAALSNFPFDDEIRIRQQNIRKGLPYMISQKIDSPKKLFTAALLCRWYGFGAVLRKITKK